MSDNHKLQIGKSDGSTLIVTLLDLRNVSPGSTVVLNVCRRRRFVSVVDPLNPTNENTGMLMCKMFKGNRLVE